MQNDKELEVIKQLEEKGYKFLRWHDFKDKIMLRMVDVECLETGYRVRKTVKNLLTGERTKERYFFSLKSGYVIFNINKHLRDTGSPYRVLSESVEKSGDMIEIEFKSQFGEIIKHKVRYAGFLDNEFIVPMLEIKQAKLFKFEGVEKRYRQNNINQYNYYIEHDSYLEMITFDKFGEEFARIKIDKDDFDRVRKFNWNTRNDDMYTCSSTGASSEIGRKYLHRFIMDCPKDLYVDHINGDKFDNRKRNLRICTNQENNFNKAKLRKNNTSGVTGVSWDESCGKWCVRFNIGGITTRHGYFSDMEEAKQKRRSLEKEFFGDFAPIYEDEVKEA